MSFYDLHLTRIKEYKAQTFLCLKMHVVKFETARKPYLKYADFQHHADDHWLVIEAFIVYFTQKEPKYFMRI